MDVFTVACQRRQDNGGARMMAYDRYLGSDKDNDWVFSSGKGWRYERGSKVRTDDQKQEGFRRALDWLLANDPDTHKLLLVHSKRNQS